MAVQHRVDNLGVLLHGFSYCSSHPVHGAPDAGGGAGHWQTRGVVMAPLVAVPAACFILSLISPYPCSVCGPHFEAKFQSLDKIRTILKKIQFQC